MKDKVVSFRLSQKEYDSLVKLANKEGLEVKDYIKQRIFSSPVVYKISCKEKDLESYLRKTIKNTNEILKRVNKENKCATRDEIILIMLAFLTIFNFVIFLKFRF